MTTADGHITRKKQLNFNQKRRESHPFLDTDNEYEASGDSQRTVDADFPLKWPVMMPSNRRGTQNKMP